MHVNMDSDFDHVEFVCVIVYVCMYVNLHQVLGVRLYVYVCVVCMYVFLYAEF
jgi:hypothetical protein